MKGSISNESKKLQKDKLIKKGNYNPTIKDFGLKMMIQGKGKKKAR